MEDATYTLLQDFVDSLSNLSSEVGHLLCEIAYLDYAKQPSKDDQPPVSQAGNGESGSNKKWYSVDESLRKAASKQSAIVRYSHKAPNSLLTLNPREPLLVERALAHYEDAIKLSKEKEKFATRAVSLVSRHLDCLNLELVKLEATTGIDVPEFNRDASETVTVPPGPSGNALASTSGNSCTPAPDLASSRIKRKHSAMETPSPLGLSYTLPIVSPTGTPTAANKRRLTSSRQTIRARAGSANVHTDHKPPAPIVGDRVEVEADEGEVSNGGDDTTLYCFCQKVSYGEMIGCDNKTCQYEWFHVPCLGLKETPFGNWYCPQCTAEGKGEKFLQTGRHRKRA